MNKGHLLVVIVVQESKKTRETYSRMREYIFYVWTNGKMTEAFGIGLSLLLLPSNLQTPLIIFLFSFLNVEEFEDVFLSFFFLT